MSVYETAYDEVNDCLKVVGDKLMDADSILSELQYKAGDSKEWDNLKSALEDVRQQLKQVVDENFEKVLETVPDDLDDEWKFSNK